MVPQSIKFNSFTLLYYNIFYSTPPYFKLYYALIVFYSAFFSTFLLHFTLLYSTLLYNRLFITCKFGQKNKHMVVMVVVMVMVVLAYLVCFRRSVRSKEMEGRRCTWVGAR